MRPQRLRHMFVLRNQLTSIFPIRNHPVTFPRFTLFAAAEAIGYLLRHWKPLTLFLRQAVAPLDNNMVERSLERAVLHQKNALFYRTLNGAQVGDLFMSLIHTCQLCGANSSTT